MGTKRDYPTYQHGSNLGITLKSIEHPKRLEYPKRALVSMFPFMYQQPKKRNTLYTTFTTSPVA